MRRVYGLRMESGSLSGSLKSEETVEDPRTGGKAYIVKDGTGMLNKGILELPWLLGKMVNLNLLCDRKLQLFWVETTG